jgi:hypothetical protein
MVKGNVSRVVFFSSLKIKSEFFVCALGVFKIFGCLVEKIISASFELLLLKTITNSKNRFSNSLQRACCDIQKAACDS